jgi:O-acetyl-ADP-ribose deacetylase (regulator of RNase III)
MMMTFYNDNIDTATFERNIHEKAQYAGQGTSCQTRDEGTKSLDHTAQEATVQIIYRTGDVFAATEPVLIQGCNARGIMGAGFSLAVVSQARFAYDAYRRVYLKRGLRLGEVIWTINVAPGQRPRIIGNAITQEFYGNERRHVDYEAIREAIRHVDDFIVYAHDHISIAALPEINAVAMPLIGAGLGGGDWAEIAAIIEQESHNFQPVVYRLEGAVR